MQTRLAAVILLSAGTAAYAQGPVTSYGPEEMVYGSCRPAIAVWNMTKDTIDYLQIDVVYRLRDGRIVTLEHKSRYQYGVANPIAPGASHALVVHHDESTPLGAACNDVLKGTIAQFVCRTSANQPCAAMPGLRVGAELAMPKRP